MKILFLLLGLYATTIKAQTTTIEQPKFLDNGKTVDSLVKVYNCEGVEYNNWDDKKPSDSCLTVCLINSTKVPSMNIMEGFENTIRQFKEIASAVRKSLTNPQAYKAFHIVFIKKEKFAGMDAKTPAGGMEISIVEL